MPGGDGAGLVEDDRVDLSRGLEHLRSLDQDPELSAPARADEQRRRSRETECARARDDQDGNRRRKGEGEPGSRSDPVAEASRRRSRSRRARRSAETRSASRCTGAFPVWASVTSRAIWASAVSAPMRSASTTSLPPTLTVAPATASPTPTSTGTLSPVSSDWSTAECPRRRRRRSRPSRPGGRRRDRRPAAARSGHDARCRRRRGARRPWRRARQRSQRCSGAALRARLEVAAGEQEHGHDRCDLEVDLVGARGALRAGPARTASSSRWSPASRKKSATTDQPQAESVPSEISVSIVAAAWRRFFQAAAWNGQPAQRTTGVASCERQPLPVRELQRGDHAHQQHGEREHRGER